MKKKKGRSIVVSILVYFFAGIGSCLALLLLLVLFMPQPHYHDGFRNLDELEAYAKKLDENIKMDTDNTIKPDFSSYYKTLAPTWKTRLKARCKHLLEFVHLAKPPIWSAGFFKTQLESLIATREVKHYKDQFICKLTATANSKFVLFGNVQGSFHSLVRCLAKLTELGIISRDLKIITPEYFIIFVGDVIDRSPFTMDTLSAVCKLLALNPDNVVYMRGNHESNNYWQEHTLKTELQIRAAHLSKSTIPLADEVNKFFGTLPIAIYITANDGSPDVIRISDAGRSQNEMLNEQTYAPFLTTKSSGNYSCFNLKDKIESSTADTVNVKVIFKGEKKRETYQPHDGLRLLPPDMGSVAWTVLSCPNMVYQKAIKFFHDAFVVITPAKELDDWSITLYNRDVRTKEPFKATTFALLSGKESIKKQEKEMSDQVDKKVKNKKAKEEVKEEEQEEEQAKPEPTRVPAQEPVTSPAPVAPPQVPPVIQAPVAPAQPVQVPVLAPAPISSAFQPITEPAPQQITPAPSAVPEEKPEHKASHTPASPAPTVQIIIQQMPMMPQQSASVPQDTTKTTKISEDVEQIIQHAKAITDKLKQ